MGILTIEQIVSADGFAADPDGGLSFFEAVDFDEGGRADEEQLAFLHDVDAILLGRRTYEMFAAFWPTANPAVEPVAEPINRLPKLVLSSTLERAPWGEGEAEIVKGDVVSVVEDLKERFASIVVWGSLTLADAVLQAGLVDRLRLRIVPVLIGDGRGFTPASLGQRRLHLEQVHQHPTGHLTTQYALR